MPIIFGGEKLPFWVRKKPSYYFRKANISCKILGIQFRSLQFSIIWVFSYGIGTDQIMLAHTNVPRLLKAIKRYEKAENCILCLYSIISRWVPLSLVFHYTVSRWGHNLKVFKAWVRNFLQGKKKFAIFPATIMQLITYFFKLKVIRHLDFDAIRIVQSFDRVSPGGDIRLSRLRQKYSMKLIFLRCTVYLSQVIGTIYRRNVLIFTGYR